MSRILFAFALLLAVATAFVQVGAPLRAPAQQATMSRAVAPSMVVEESEAVVTAVSAASSLIAAQAGDFGGYTIPVIGLGLLAAIIGILAGPVED